MFAESIRDSENVAGPMAPEGLARSDAPRFSPGLRDEGLQRINDLFTAWHGAKQGRISVFPAAALAETSSPELLQAVRAFAEKHDLGYTIHLSQSQPEVDFMVRYHGVRPPAFLDRHGFLGPRLFAAHCRYVDDGDVALLGRSGTIISHQANMAANRGVIPPIAKLRAAGCPIANGTDNNTNDLFGVMKVALLTERISRNDAIPGTRPQPEDMLEDATQGGARVRHTMSPMKRLSLFRAVGCVLMLAAVRPAAAQSATARSLPNEPGKWKPWTFINLSSSDLEIVGVTLSEARAFEARLEQIAEIFRTSPVWNPPMGGDPALSGMAFGPDAHSSRAAKKLTYRPIAGYIMMGSFEHFEVIRTPGGQEHPERIVGGETSHIMVDVNLLPGGAGVNPLADEDGVLYEQPVRTADIGGFPTYGDLLIITTNGRPIWTPVSRERFLEAFIAKRRPEAANAETFIAEQQKSHDAFVAPEAAAARQAKYKAEIDKVASKGAAAVEHERRYWERDEADRVAALKRGASRDPKDSSFVRDWL